MTQSEYEDCENRMFLADLERANRSGTVAERRAASEAFAEVLRTDPALVAERVGWLIAGNYGYGSYRATAKVLENPRMNREAWLCLTISALEWQCPHDKAASAFTSLTLAEQTAVKAAIRDSIKSWEEAQAEEAKYQASQEASK